MVLSIDLNCDLGEGCDNDEELMKLISSANIACGFHAGDQATMERTVTLAIENGVAIGVHPSYPDRENFGRTDMELLSKEIFAAVAEQVSTMAEICERLGARMHHVKPHGALYNRSARDPEVASVIAESVYSIEKTLILYGLAGSISITEAEKAGLLTAEEGFADRTYAPDGSLTPRGLPNALISDPDAAARQVVQMVKAGTVTATDGTAILQHFETVCVHGDGPNAAMIATTIRKTLLEEGIAVIHP